MLLTVLTDLILLEKGILYNSFLIFCLFNVITLYELVLIKFVNCSGSQIASAKAAQHRLDRGVWTTVRFGDMRRSLSGMNLTQSISLLSQYLKPWLNFLIFHHDPKYFTHSFSMWTPYPRYKWCKWAKRLQHSSLSLRIIQRVSTIPKEVSRTKGTLTILYNALMTCSFFIIGFGATSQQLHHAVSYLKCLTSNQQPRSFKANFSIM
jgi:hypothetical protein